MSLWDKGTGLLETHVEWEDVEEALSSSLGVPCKSGSNRSLFQVGEGRGFLSRIAVVSPCWEDNFGILPEKLCVKICSPQIAFDEVMARTEKMENVFKLVHNSEVDTYEIFEKHRTPELKAAKFYTGRRFSDYHPSKGFLVLSFFENLQEVHIVDNMKLSEVDQVLEAIVEMNCVTFKLSEEEMRKISKEIFSTVCATYCVPEYIDGKAKKLRLFMEKDHPELCDRLDEIKYDIYSREAFKELDALCQTLGMTPLITHGDLWSTNLLWSRKEGEDHKLEAIVDYQKLALSAPAADVCSFLCSALSGVDRINNTNRLLKRYFELLTAKTPGRQLFSLEQLKLSFIHVFPFHGLEILGIMVEIYEELLKNPVRQLPPEEVVLEKIFRLLENVLEYYELSKRIKRGE